MTTPRQALDALIDLFAPDIRSAFLASVQDLTDNIVVGGMIDAIQQGDVEAAFRTLGFSPAAMRPLTAAIERAYETGGVMTGKTFPKYLNTPSGKAVFRFDVRNSRAEAWLRDKSSILVARIEDDTRRNLRNVLTAGMEEGRNPRNVALDIVGRVGTDGKRTGGVVGLAPNQEAWVRSARTRLLAAGRDDTASQYFNMELRDKRFDKTVQAAIDSGKPLPADVIDKLVMRYKDNALKHRGENIGRTEAMQALNASEYEATKQAVDTGAIKNSNVQREWDSAGDMRVRPSHVKLDGIRVGLDEPFVSPLTGARMMFPGDTSFAAPANEIIACRCRARSVIDWLDDLD
jgi:hypothetical protein